MTFFPQLIAGPIVHHKDVMPQFDRPYQARPSDLSVGLAIFAFGLAKKVLFVSHRWESQDTPDGMGAQKDALQAHLRANPAIEFIWYDYSCMAQRDASGHRSASDEAEFSLMLAAIADLYLTSNVLILLDNTYMTRFWTLMEAWCAMMTATSGGVKRGIRWVYVTSHKASRTASAFALVAAFASPSSPACTPSV